MAAVLWRRCVVQAAILGVLICSTGAQAQVRPKKLIQTGHDMPTAQQLRRDLRVMEQSPFDGVVLEIATENVSEGVSSCPFREMFANTKWQRDWFRRSIADLRAIQSGRLRDNFANTNGNPGNVDWFDDAGWASIVEHFRIAAWVAREGGMKGILFDAEPYVQPYRQFAYRTQPQRAQHSFHKYYARARQRGQEVMRAMASEYPDITIFTYFMNSYVVDWDPWGGPSAAGLADPRHALAAHSYGLYPAFIDGWLDAAPATVTFIDGNERAYGYTEASQFWKAAMEIKGPAQEVVSPENRAKYRAQVQVSSGIYLDAHLGPQHRYWLGGRPEDRAAMLERNVAAALQAADEYVWVYGEQGRWWPDPEDTAPWKGRRVGTLWIELIPGIVEALTNARDPEGSARQARLADVASLEHAGQLANLARNGDFGVGPNAAPASARGDSPDWVAGNAPAGWSSWQEDDSKGTVGWDPAVGCAAPGAGRLSNVNGGCLIQTHEVKPGQRHFVRVMARRTGEGLPTLSVGWKTPDGKWMGDDVLAERFRLHPEVFFPETSGPDEWGTLSMEVATPEGAGQMIVMPGVSSQASPRDVAWFDDICVYPLGPKTGLSGR